MNVRGEQEKKRVAKETEEEGTDIDRSLLNHAGSFTHFCGQGTALWMLNWE